MNKFLLITLGICLNSGLYSQYTDTTLENNTDDIRKNTIGVNVSPIITVLTGSSRFDPIASLQYKRHFDKYNLRGTAFYKYHRSTGIFGNNRNLIKVEDSIYTFESYDYTSNTMHAKIGLEWVKNKNRFSWLVGGDLIFGTYISDHDVHNSTRIYSMDSLGNILSVSSYYPYGSIKATFTRNHYLVTGLGLVLGLDFKINEKLGLTIQFEPTISYRIGLNQDILEVDYSQNTPSQKTTNSIDYSYILFDVSPLSFYVNYKF